MPLFHLLCPRFWYPLYTLSVTLRLIAGPITFLGRLLVLIIFLMAVILILIDPLDDEMLDEMSKCLLALRLGLPFAPSYLGQSGSVQDMTRGLNYASASAGVIFSSGSELVYSKTKILFKLQTTLSDHKC
ncbi:hypothetical protein Hanom_Chr03g00207581 [Helianthus anomalus]